MNFSKENMNRKIKSHHRKKRLFIFNLQKSETMVLGESFLEFYGNILLDYENIFTRLNTQPLTASIPFLDEENDATPDTLALDTANKFHLIEWKYLYDYLEHKDKYDNIGKTLESTGLVTYRIMTNLYVYKQPRLKNTLKLYRLSLSSQPDKKSVQSIREFMGEVSKSLGEATKWVKENNIQIQALWWLIGRQFIEINRDEIFTNNTPLTWSKDHEI